MVGVVDVGAAGFADVEGLLCEVGEGADAVTGVATLLADAAREAHVFGAAGFGADAGSGVGALAGVSTGVGSGLFGLSGC